jgi:hypothetical protein
MLGKFFLLTYLLALLLFFSALAQDWKSAVEAYHKNIDPERKIKDIKSITSVRYFHVSELSINQEHVFKLECHSSSEGINCKRIESISGPELPDPEIKLPAHVPNINAMEFSLNFILNYEDVTRYTLEYMNDSITVISETVNAATRKIYVIDNRSSQLIQQKNITNTPFVKYVSETNYLKYKRINGILIPEETKIISSLFTSTVKLLNIQLEFEN